MSSTEQLPNTLKIKIADVHREGEGGWQGVFRYLSPQLEVIRRKPLLRPHHKMQLQKFAKELLNRTEAFWKQVRKLK